MRRECHLWTDADALCGPLLGAVTDKRANAQGVAEPMPAFSYGAPRADRTDPTMTALSAGGREG
jgi:hypothetical protein